MKDTNPNSDERPSNVIHRILRILIAGEMTPRQSNFVIGILIFLSLFCLLLNVIVFIPSEKLFELSPPLRSKVSDLELALLTGGILSVFLPLRAGARGTHRVVERGTGGRQACTGRAMRDALPGQLSLHR